MSLTRARTGDQYRRHVTPAQTSSAQKGAHGFEKLLALSRLVSHRRYSKLVKLARWAPRRPPLVHVHTAYFDMSTQPDNRATQHTNPMKKRFRSWQPVEEEPRPRRRYPRLVVRDRTGNHIANDIATAPKVELPLKPIVPRAVTFPTSSVSKPEEELQLPNEGTPSRHAPTRLESPDCSTSTEDRGPQLDSQRSQSPSSPLLAKSSAVNADTVLQAPSRRDGISPQQPVHAPVPAARVHPMPVHTQAEYRSPQNTPRPRATSGGYAPYGSSSCSPTPPVGHIVTASAQRGGSHAAQPVDHTATQHAGQLATHVVHSTPPGPSAYQASRAPDYDVLQTAPAPPPVDSYPSGNKPQSERIILAGKRCGTVEYWRSSLQMPREKGVVKSVKAPAPQTKRRVKQGTPERAVPIQPASATEPPPSTSAAARVSSGYAPGYSAGYAPQRSVQPADYSVQSRPEQNPRRPESEIEHEFWRTATKLPRASAETTRVKRLAHGRRRYEGAYVDNPRETGARSMNNMMVAGSPVSGRYGGAQQAGPVSMGMQGEYVPQAHAPAPIGSHSGAPMQAGAGPSVQVSRQAIVARPDLTRRDRVNRAKAESETRRLLFLRDFELRRLRTLAQSKFHVKMNLRGRMKLEQWVCSDEVTMAASSVIVTMFNLDRRVLSGNDDIRRNALYDMTNEDLRILEALMSRITSRGGRTNWALLTSSLSHESFTATIPTE